MTDGFILSKILCPSSDWNRTENVKNEEKLWVLSSWKSEDTILRETTYFSFRKIYFSVF